ncbi:Non-heme dioxygenase N-terminal domain containing protein [Parasponia andersonii]|uniref:Non-heme dioxygenase N-terminal domain containing protein n=1 Tax=Parasponia andersonii TaxID=3476 RepID=A0A2P5E0B7_PARAD|nr:Non-heme dioxygenase N-terminal domain containing protein [Parasponia andersonii]
MASSTQKQQLTDFYGGATSAPPPTPSAQPINLLSSVDAADALSRLLHRLPPALSLSTRRAGSSTATSPPLVSFPDEVGSANNINLHDLLSSSSQLGFFQLANHSVPTQLANSAESEALSLFDLPREKKESYFPRNWPLGYEAEDRDEEGDGLGESFCLDSSCSAESTELELASLRELTRALEKVGLRIFGLISGSLGFENPLEKDDPARFCTLTWISEDQPGKRAMTSGRFYPYIVGLQYQIRSRKYSMLADSGWVSVLPQVDSVLVTIGDIAQVWSNGKLKKVRERAVGSSGEGMNNNKKSRSVSISVLVTLPLDTRVSPLVKIPKQTTISEDVIKNNNEEEEEELADDEEEEKRMFNSFSFEDYAWRVYHERLNFKDPLDRYRIIT